MKKILQSCMLLIALFPALNTQAQALRYLDSVFANVTVDTSIVYGLNKSYPAFATLDSLRMDVYRPTGDNDTNRPVIIFMHAGSYLPGGATGLFWANRRENCLVELCNRYAKRGWVAVSMSYRLGWNPSEAQHPDGRTGTILRAVFRSMQDAKTCIRYFRDNKANHGNQWGIDPTKFVLGGTNSGAYTALAAGNLNKQSEVVLSKFLDTLGNSFIDTTLIGNFDGWGGSQNYDNYPGISGAFNASLPLGGAIGDTTWVESGEPAVIAFSGVSDPLTPFNTAVVTTAANHLTIIEVSGPGDFMPVVTARGNNSGFAGSTFADGPPNRNGLGAQTSPIDGLYPFWGGATVGFEPWNWYDPYTNPPFNPTATQAKAMAYIDTIMGFATPRLYRLLIDPTYGDPLGIKELNENVQLNIFPNPASSNLNVSVTSSKTISAIRLLDLTGRSIKAITGLNNYSETLDVSGLSGGVYLLHVKLSDGTDTARRVVLGE